MKKVLLAGAGFAAAFFLMVSTGCEHNDDETVVTLAEYNEIQYGMSYDQVVAIVGDDPTSGASASGGPYGASAWAYVWENDDDSRMVVTFATTNGSVVAKAQQDLE